jgi:PAS domain S-box-containing protein
MTLDPMLDQSRVNILLVDDQPAKLLTYEAMLGNLGENLLRAGSGREALEHLLKSEIAVILVDVCMPDLDGFQLAAMIREHPRFRKTAIIFISAIHLSDMDRLRGYEMGAVDYVPVPVIPEVLRAKVRIFCELYRKTRQLEVLNAELEQRVMERTAELEAAARKLKESERGRSMALAAGDMGSWEWDRELDQYFWDEGQYRIFGVEASKFEVTSENIRAHIHPDDWVKLQIAVERLVATGESLNTEFRVVRPNGELRWCIGIAAGIEGSGARLSGVTVDVTERRKAEERQALLAREVDHRSKNALALVQSIIRLTKADSQQAYMSAVEGRIRALSIAHNVLAHSRWMGANLRGLIEEELEPYLTADAARISLQGRDILLQPAAAQTLALALHELATNAAKYGALSTPEGRVSLDWDFSGNRLDLTWDESGGPELVKPTFQGFGSRIINASIERQLGGSVKSEWRPEGLTCRISVPCGEGTVVAKAVRANWSEIDGVDGMATLRLKGNRILVVEDESLVALALVDVLKDLGYEVVGPCSSVPEALNTIANVTFDAAILDLNLKGEMVYPAAEMLQSRNIPFVFMTGYGAEGIDTRFRQVSALQKPVERESFVRLFPKTATRH